MPNFEVVNKKVVKALVRPGQNVMSRKGAMLAYTGQVNFYPGQSSSGTGMGAGGLTGAVGRAMAGEHVGLMVADGSGEIFYGHQGTFVVVFDLDGTQRLSVEADRLLAHDMTLTRSVMFFGEQGGVMGAVRGAVSGQGLFTTILSGAGQAAVISHGEAFRLQVRPDRPIVVDPQAYVAHLGDINLQVKANVSWRNAVGRSSGETIQLHATGSGTVLVQPSEHVI